MVRTFFTVPTAFACSMLVLVATSTGCRMCASPYDECGPTFTGECGQECCPNVRRGSILSPGVDSLQYEMEAMEPTLAERPHVAPPEETAQTLHLVPNAEHPVDRLDVALWNPLIGR